MIVLVGSSVLPTVMQTLGLTEFEVAVRIYKKKN